MKLVKEKYSILFTPIIYALDQVNNITKADPETPNEENFRAKNGAHIAEFLESVRNPADWSKPCTGWASFVTLQVKFYFSLENIFILFIFEIAFCCYRSLPTAPGGS